VCQQGVDCEPHPGFLVKTSEGYYGILLRKEGGDQWLVFLANGLMVQLSRTKFQMLPLSNQSNAPASFREILKNYSDTTFI
jgi:hypothetical protein